MYVPRCMYAQFNSKTSKVIRPNRLSVIIENFENKFPNVCLTNRNTNKGIKDDIYD